MADNRQVTIKVRDRQVSGGSIPGDALFGEPFVNLYNGVLRFSGVTGGDFEPSSQTGVFEVGSSLYSQKITNRLNINDNFIISGGTGIISTYEGTSGAGLSGKFLSGTTSGFVLGNISDIQGVTTRVQPGVNITTGGTDNFPTVNLVASPSVNNITFSGAAFGGTIQAGAGTFTSLSATTLSGGTIYSAGTNVETIIYNIVNGTELNDITRVQPGSNITTGGTDNFPVINLAASPSVNNLTFSGTAIGGDVQVGAGTFTSLSAATLSGGTILSGGTNLYSIFAPFGTVSGVETIGQGSNIVTGGTAVNPTISLTDSPSVNNLTFSGVATGGAVNATSLSATSLTNTRVLFAGANGLITDDSSLTFNSSTDVLTIGGAGNLTTNGTTYSGGTITDDGIFTIDAATRVEIDSDLLPTINLTYDLGAVGQRWDELYVRRVNIGTSTTVIEDNLFSSTTGNMVFNFAGDLDVDNNIVPLLNKTYDLGESATRWNTIYAQDLDLAGDLSVTGITDSSLTAGRVVYVGASGRLVDEAGFEYDQAANLLKSRTLQVGVFGDTGTTLTVYGDILAIGQAISGFTSELYIEDNLIELNYNPTGDTSSTSLGAGWSIQDGSGVAGTDAIWDIRGTATGLENRSFTTNLGNIRVAESGTVSSPNGLFVLKSTDIIDGGSY